MNASRFARYLASFTVLAAFTAVQAHAGDVRLHIQNESFSVNIHQEVLGATQQGLCRVHNSVEFQCDLRGDGEAPMIFKLSYVIAGIIGPGHELASCIGQAQGFGLAAAFALVTGVKPDAVAGIIGPGRDIFLDVQKLQIPETYSAQDSFLSNLAAGVLASIGGYDPPITHVDERIASLAEGLQHLGVTVCP